jgi:hypothetical protein
MELPKRGGGSVVGNVEGGGTIFGAGATQKAHGGLEEGISADNGLMLDVPTTTAPATMRVAITTSSRFGMCFIAHQQTWTVVTRIYVQFPSIHFEQLRASGTPGRSMGSSTPAHSGLTGAGESL